MNGWVEGRGDWTGGSPWLCPLFLNFNNNIKKIANVDEEKVKATISTTNLKLILQMKWLFSASDLIGSFIWYDMYLLVLRFFLFSSVLNEIFFFSCIFIWNTIRSTNAKCNHKKGLCSLCSFCGIYLNFFISNI